tara:strand:- start:1068 stop:1493 length:426 start_codon:yes stop_codon:yes gene_type:complete
MAKLSDLSSSLFEKTYSATARIVMCDDVVHRKNKDFARKALKSSGFSKFMVHLLTHLPETCCAQILGDHVTTRDVHTEDLFAASFLETNCRHYINYHDEKMCTVEFVCKFETNVQILCFLPEPLLSQLHVEVRTPVGEVQL